MPYQAFKCKDGKYMVGAGNDKQVRPVVERRSEERFLIYPPYLYFSSYHTLSQFEKLAAVVGMPELSQDNRFRTNKDRTQHRKILVDILQTFFLTKTRAELDTMFEVRSGVED